MVAGGQVAFRAPGSLPGASVAAVGVVLLLLLSLVSGCGLVLLIRWHSGLFGAVCVALFPPLQCMLGASCCCRLVGALFVCFRFCLVGLHSWGWLSVLGCAFWGFLLSFAPLHLSPLLRFVVTDVTKIYKRYKETRKWEYV